MASDTMAFLRYDGDHPIDSIGALGPWRPGEVRAVDPAWVGYLLGFRGFVVVDAPTIPLTAHPRGKKSAAQSPKG